jgi:hypothetical protein
MVNSPEGDNARGIFVCILENAGKGCSPERTYRFERRLRLENGADKDGGYPFGQKGHFGKVVAKGYAVGALPAFGNIACKRFYVAYAPAHIKAFGHIGRTADPNPVAQFHRER